MFSWLKRETKTEEVVENVLGELKKIYKSKLLPLEEHYSFHDFHSPKLEDPDFDAKPMILLVGQYSTGKTTFIRYLLERDFPGIRIGPEPTTDRFIAVMFDEKEGMIPGNALVVDPKKQFRPLGKYGNAFLNRFQCSTVPSPVLRAISIVDTPGILSGEKQRVDRGYDFTGVLEWFAERVDRIILLFDAHKLDISDEFRRSIEALRGHDDKIRIVLNKADMIDHQQLMRVYGALMWSLGKVLQTPEVARVYIGSFWDQPLRYDVNRRLFEDEEQDLFRDLQSLPRNAALRKLNDLIKRARLAKVHAFIIAELRKDMPSMFGKDSKKKELIKNLGQVYDRIQKEHQISPGDFPDIKKMQEVLANQDFSKFHSLKIPLLEVVDRMLATDIARLMSMIPQEEMTMVSEPLIKEGLFGDYYADSRKQWNGAVKRGAFDGVEDVVSPFGYRKGEGIDAGYGEVDWICNRDRERTDPLFETLNPVDGKISGAAAKSELIKSKLPNNVLSKIWKLSDYDQDGFLDIEEFALAMHLINVKMDGNELPMSLPPHLIPPSKRNGVPE
ncbi:EH domain-containing protein 1 isoform X1 [Uranotaenia lowii]|uniref:EH domain-containing protein 1 isoform X1 n=1 Tax=Uranotaenia lowii TaxID=190385 RepID=UPI002478A4A3|nr:EH domain-containing protein 1 isoform X1 [Uranotaenia lowii]XP_055587225.1 EH domain-containing protein 1 isoform X1 [Uranotaenia lowii]XP_055587226.1 EH domain-containing protein 1 isoform X1 [Uranotaenia lowii]